MAGITVVTNASPLIYLTILDRFSLLRECFGEIWLPQAVYHEVVIQGAGRPGAEATLTATAEGTLRLATVSNQIALDALLDELHLGEAETIVLARELNAEHVLLDDGAARIKARSMGLKVTGTIGVLLLARQVGIDIDLAHDLNILIRENFHLSRALYDMLTSSTDTAPAPDQ